MNKKQEIIDARAWYGKAFDLDRKGFEKKAEGYYEAVYRLGWRKLPAKERPGFFVGYGSTLRNNRKFKRSAKILSEGVKNFPHYPALKIFLALSLYSNKKFKQAAAILFRSCLDMPEKPFNGYSRAINYYVSHLKR